MLIYEAVFTVVLKKDIPYLNSFTVLSEALNYSMLNSRELKKAHKDLMPKYYNFSGLYPVEKNRAYQKGRIYVFRVRCLEESFAHQIIQCMKASSFEVMDLIATDLKKKDEGHIRELVSITPIVLTSDEGYVLPEHNPLEFIEKRIIGLLEKKYHNYYEEKIQVPQFCNGLIKTNRIPIKIPYKSIHFLAHKVKMQIADNPEAQKLANLALATGIGEKTSLGMGYVVANYYKEGKRS